LRLTKLELHGFKSFAKKTQMVFDSGITAVIGPNGSGKSNIADAVRWVLGEQSAKALRGAKMEDVIFGGTQERKAQAYCEVLLTFDNIDGTLPVDFNEVTVGRRVYRSGESEYELNRNNCRLKDIQEIFRDTGIGKEGYSIIGQGRVEEILSNRSNERRAALEEAAGVMKYRVRKEEAVRRLDHTRKNLERLMDILDELELRREPLREQSKTARIYLQLRDELRHLDINVFLFQYERTKERMKNTEAAIAQLKSEGGAQEETERALAADCAAQEGQVREIEKAAAALQNLLLEEMSAMEAHAGEVSVLVERKEHLGKEYERLQQALLTNKIRRDEIRAQLDTLSGADSREMLKAMEEDVLKEEAKLQERQQQIERQEQLIEQQKNSIIEQLNRLSDAKSQLSRMEAMTAALNQRLETLDSEFAAITAEREGLNEELAAAQKEYDAEEQKRNALLARCEDAQQRMRQAAEERREAEHKHRELEQKVENMRSRVSVLEEMARAHEGYYASVRNVMRDSARNMELRQCVLGVVAELIQVPEKFETALEMSLGSALQNIVTPTPQHAKRVIEHLRRHQYGRATLLPVSAMRPRLLSGQERACLNEHGCIGVAAEMVGFKEEYRAVVENLLGRTVICETLEAGIALNKRANAAFRIATLQGDIIHPGGSMTGGSVQKREFSLLGRERETKQLLQSTKEHELLMQQFAQKKWAAQQNETACGELVAQAQARIHAFNIDNVRNKEKLELILRDIQINEQKRQRAQTEQGQISDNLDDIATDRQEIVSVQSGIEAGSATTKDDVLSSQAQLNAMRAAHDKANAALTERKVRRMALLKEEDAIENEKKRLTRELEQLEQSIYNDMEQCKINHQQKESLSDEITSLREDVNGKQSLIDRHKEQHTAMEEERQKLAQTLGDIRGEREALIVGMRELNDKMHRQDLLYNRAELEFQNMQERILEEYELTYETALPLRAEQFGVTAAHVRIDELRAAIRELGNINVNAVDDYQALNERYEQLQLQCDDLNKAERDLQTLIGELTATMEAQFSEQFRRIQQNFSIVFEQLFGGGRAELRLADVGDALNCDIDIIAQPPGKKLQLLSLLSGGERALTAIALLFAILKLKPTVFCILDEIESSLDEVNVTRFANYLRAYAEDTQFILITHRKGSMEVCNTLYGVAMEEKGVSKIVSARLQDVETNAS
jgi:chromosome segregation protein